MYTWYIHMYYTLIWPFITHFLPQAQNSTSSKETKSQFWPRNPKQMNDVCWSPFTSNKSDPFPFGIHFGQVFGKDRGFGICDPAVVAPSSVCNLSKRWIPWSEGEVKGLNFWWFTLKMVELLRSKGLNVEKNSGTKSNWQVSEATWLIRLL